MQGAGNGLCGDVEGLGSHIAGRHVVFAEAEHQLALGGDVEILAGADLHHIREVGKVGVSAYSIWRLTSASSKAA